MILQEVSDGSRHWFPEQGSEDLMGRAGITLEVHGLDGAVIYYVLVFIALFREFGDEGGHCC